MAPTVNLTAPANNTRFATGSDITLTANASAAPGRSLSQVEFYRGTTLIGSATIPPYSVIWSGAAEGDYAITAKAIDDNSGAAVSDPVNVKVTSNLLPTVSLTSPAMNTSYTAPALIRLVAEAQGTSSTITHVEFFSDDILIGIVTSAPYVFDWNNTLPGTYNITAKATDSNAATATSSAKTISVVLGVRQAYYIHSDHLNTPRLITSELDMPVWRWDSDPFGSTVANEDPSSTGTPFVYNPRFPGQYFDQETGLHYNYFRDYDPETGRYIESDPIGLEGGINTYAYVIGNPLWFTDLYGLLVGTASGGIGGGIMVGPVGAFGTTGATIGTDGTRCSFLQACVRIGWGGFIGLGLNGSLGMNGGGTQNSGGGSIGVGGDVGVGAGAGGFVGVGSGSASITRGSVGLGLGLAVGLDLCETVVIQCWDKCGNEIKL